MSYAREDLEFVRRLSESLTAEGYEVWVDLEGILPTADWLEEIRRAIERSDACVFVTSPDFVGSTVCLEQELSHAVRQHKRLIPVLARAVEAESLPRDLSRLNWIDFTAEAEYEAAVRILVAAIETDLDWVQDHTLLLDRAQEWKRQGRTEALAALPAGQLDHFESWLAQATDREPTATELQVAFLLECRRVAEKRRRQRLIALGVLILVVGILGFWAYLQNQEKLRQQEIVQARKLIYQAEQQRDQLWPPGQLVQATRKAIEATRRSSAAGERLVEADQALRETMALLPGVLARRQLGPGDIRAAAIDAEGRFAAAAYGPESLLVWDSVRREDRAVCRFPLVEGASLTGVMPVVGGGRLAVASYHGTRDTTTLTVLDLDECSRVAVFQAPGRSYSVRAGGGGLLYALVASARSRVWKVGSPEPLALGANPDLVLDLDLRPRAEQAALLVRNLEDRNTLLTVVDLGGTSPQRSFRFEGRRNWIRWTSAPDQVLVGARGDVVGFGLEPLRPGPLLMSTFRVSEQLVQPSPAMAWSPATRWLAVPGSSWVSFRRFKPGFGLARRDQVRLGFSGDLAALALGPDGDTAVTIGNGQIQTWRLEGGREYATLKAPEPLDEVEFEGRLVRARSGHRAYAWDLPADSSYQPLSEREPGPWPARDPRFRVQRPDEQEARLAVYRQGQSSPERTLEFDSRLLAWTLHGESGRLSVVTGRSTRGGWERQLHLVNLGDGTTRTMSLPGRAEDQTASSLTHTEDGAHLVTLSRDFVELRDSGTGEAVLQLPHSGARAAAKQPGGPVIVTHGAGFDTRVWDLASAVEFARIEHEWEPVRLRVSPDGRWLASLERDGALRLWALQPADLIAQARSRLPSG